MTGDEMERAIEFILQSQANHESRLGELTEKTNQLTEQIAETNRIVRLQGETQTSFMQIVTQHIEAQAEINASLRAGNASLREAITRMDVRIDRTDRSVNRTDARLDRIAALVERYL